MKNAVVICEFNPLHIGHARLLGLARSAGARNVICVMSGSAVQRGELACLDKYTRARHAVLAGADAVIELPAQYTLSAARQFALGGVKTACTVKDATLVFGSECGDLDRLVAAAEALEDDNVRAKIKTALSEGSGYPAALAKALGDELFLSPNNTLGIEYLRAIIDTGRKISAFTVKRDNSPCEQAPHGYPTSSAIRENAKNGVAPDPSLLPGYVADDLSSHPVDDSALYAVLRYILTSQRSENVYDDTEGLSNRLASCAAKSQTYEEFCSLAASRRYTRARVKRLALNTALGNTFTHADLTDMPIRFVNLLAVAKGNEDVLSQIDVPIAVSERTRAPFADDFSLTSKADALFDAARYPFSRATLFVQRS